MIQPILKRSSMNSKKLPFFILLALLFSFASGCTTHRGDRSYTKAGGIFEHRTAAYDEVSHATIALRRSDVDSGATYSGNKTTFLWGLFTFYDY
jgi:hypothetical protein